MEPGIPQCASEVGHEKGTQAWIASHSFECTSDKHSMAMSVGY